MKTAVIRQRVADFLKRHAPFDIMADDDLLELSGSGKVKFHESAEYILQQGDAKAQFIWIVQQGRVELLEKTATGEQLRDLLGEGDLLGLDRFFGDGSCLFSARTASDVILYGIAATVLEPVLARYPVAKRFLAAHFSLSGAMGFGRTSWLDTAGPPVEFLQARLVTLPADATIAEAAAAVTGARNGVAALVDGGNRAVGLITAAELCGASQGPALSAARPSPPSASVPVKTRAAIRAMVESGSEELALTADGTPEGALEAILTASELGMFCGHNPARLAGAIRRAASAPEIIPLLQQATRTVRDGLAQPHDLDDCCRIETQTAGALASTCIRLAERDVLAAGVRPPDVSFGWFLFGASARGDLLETAVPSLAAVYDDAAERFGPVDSMYFAAIAGATLEWFGKCGLDGADLCWPEGSRPSMPLSEWKRFYRETLRDPVTHNLYARREYFDIRALAGDVSNLEAIRSEVARESAEGAMAIPLLANDTLAHLPPMTFFRGLVVDLEGGQQDVFDIAETAIAPIADAARVFALAGGRVAVANTLQRLEAAQEDYPEGSQILREGQEAFRIALYYQALAGGSRIQPSRLGKYDQRLLKTAFSSIQRLLEFTASTFLPD